VNLFTPLFLNISSFQRTKTLLSHKEIKVVWVLMWAFINMEPLDSLSLDQRPSKHESIIQINCPWIEIILRCTHCSWLDLKTWYGDQ
jgi:hypothetical protein